VIPQQKKLVVTELEQTENGKKRDPVVFLKDETDFHSLRRRPGGNEKLPSLFGIPKLTGRWAAEKQKAERQWK
jgi:hypothetical protein